MPRTLITTPPATARQRTAALVPATAGRLAAAPPRRPPARPAAPRGAGSPRCAGRVPVGQPELDPPWRFLSEYALGRGGWLMTAAFVALAVSLLGGVLAPARAGRAAPGPGGAA